MTPEEVIEILKENAKLFEGEHDFKAFCASGSAVKTTVRTVYEVRIEESQTFGCRMIKMFVTGNGFLYNMVRTMAGELIDLAKGKILYTIYRSDADGNRNHNITGIGNQPETITAIPDYDASKRFYTYGFDWHPDRLTWWLVHPTTNEKIILWDYQPESSALNGVEGFDGIPKSPTTYLLNYWHTNNWPVDTNPKSIEAPAYPYALEIDWMKYEPFVEESQTWITENNWK